MKAHHKFRLLLVAAAMLSSGAASAAINLTEFVNPHNTIPNLGGTIGFAYVGNGFVGSVQADGSNVLYRTNTTGGAVTLFAPSVSIPGGSPSSEHYVASSLGLGGFPNRDVYVAAGGRIIHIDNAGTTGNDFITSVNGSAGNTLGSAVRGILFDSIGSWNNDMLVTTNAGLVYQVDSGGHAVQIANTGEDTEGLDIAPLGTFGSHEGDLIVASEGSGSLRAIDQGGGITLLNAGNALPGAEELTFVPLNLGASGNSVEGFYGANYTPNVLHAAASEFTGMLGDIVVTSETGHGVFRVHWNGTGVDISQIGQFSSQPEDGIFVTAAIVNPCPPGQSCNPSPTPEPGSLWLLGAGIAAGLLRLRARRT